MLDFKRFMFDLDEKPLDRICDDGGFISIFRKICCIGDSLASGELESFSEGKRGYHDMFEYSWGQYIARMAGTTCYNQSRGGMTAKEFITSYADKMGYWDEKYLSQCYIIALGVNDCCNRKMAVGSFDDYNAVEPVESFAYYYSLILKKIRSLQPNARIFLVSMPHYNENHRDVINEHCKCLKQFCDNLERTYLIDLTNNSPAQDDEFRRRFKVGGHLNAAGYYVIAKMIASYVDYIIRKYPEEFSLSGFIGTDHTYEGFMR